MKTLHDIFVGELRDIYYAEKMIAEELPRMAKKATAPELKEAFEKHAEETKVHVERLEKVFKMCDLAPRGKKCLAIEGLMDEAKEMLEAAETDEVRDVVLIVSGQKVEHYEISSYGTLCEFAELLGYDDAAELFAETLEEEDATDEILSGIAEEVNKEAL